MSDEQPINPCTIPQFTGDLEALEKDRASLTSAAGTFRDAGANVDSEFQGLSAFYSAPEAAQLFATTNPVRTGSDFFADQLDSAAKALGEYVTEARPIVARLKDLQTKAATFSNKISGDEHWKDDTEKIDENRDLIHDVNAAVTAFQAAERTCANKIRALYCAPPLGYDDGSHGPNMYGFKVDDLNHSKTLPWGTQFEETHRAWELDYWAKSYVWDGIVMDGIVGTVKGLGTFVGFQGLDAAGKAWVGLAKLATGVAISTSPLLYPFWLADEKDLSPWLRDSRKAMKETGKALVAWDEWGKNPARAAGAVTFNVVTTVATGGAGSATKAGTVAKVLSATGKAGRLIDPITYISKAGSYGKFKVGELFTHFNKVDGAFPKIDDVVWKDLPKADVPGVRFPHPQDTVRLLDDALGRPQYYDKTSNQLLDHTGAPKQDLTTVPKGSDHPLAEVPKHEQVPAGVGAHTPHNSHTDPGGGSTGHGGTDTTPTGGHASGDHTPPAGAHGDGPTGGAHGPSMGGDHVPGGGDHGGSDGSGGRPPTGGHADDSLPRPEPRPFERGGETEQRIRNALHPGKPKPPDLEEALNNLADNPVGQEVADLIASGKFKGMQNFEQVVGSFSQKNAMAGGIEQLRLADQLYESGVRDIRFEIKGGVEIKPGVTTGAGTDMDVMARDADGKIYGYQFKEVANPKKAVDKMWNNIDQLEECGADVKVFVVDTKGSVADMLASGIEEKLARLYTKKEVIVVIRVEDGTLMYPPGASFMPGGRP
ncbi:hypothetical protein EES41_20500 [Streptomyces sp. ADI95-16]|uniref:hypothetical protein n=1 Tax=Streptomyces sp. ADI95-16 TaxID=1522758 RepID=UPI000F433572|nr:hypothetical protein [Streptomyces sp. ADI95-16]AYV29094.1 hypothetical protein EES41_20500 [Streptomyces sp. ADI95-16]